MNRREASKQKTRQLILNAARRLFAQKGAQECTIRDIAKKAGVSPASVVVHFQSKTALLEEALHRDIDRALAAVLESLPPDLALLERLLYLARGFFEFYDRNRDLYRALIRSTIFEPLADTPHISNLTDRYLHFLSGMLAAEKARGRLRPEVDVQVAAGAVFSLYLGALIVFFRQPELPAAAVTEILRAMTGHFLQGIII